MRAARHYRGNACGAAGAGLGGFFTPTAYGTEFAEGKETRIIDGRGHVFEMPLRATSLLVKADRRPLETKSARNFGPVMHGRAHHHCASPRPRALGELSPGSHRDARHLRPAGGAGDGKRFLQLMHRSTGVRMYFLSPATPWARRLAQDIPDGSYVNPHRHARAGRRAPAARP